MVILNGVDFQLHFSNPALVQFWSGFEMKLWFKVHHQLLLASLSHWSMWSLLMQDSIFAEHD